MQGTCEWCGETVRDLSDCFGIEQDGKWWYFCSEECFCDCWKKFLNADLPTGGN